MSAAPNPTGAQALEQLLDAYTKQRDIFVACHTCALGRFLDADDEADAAEMAELIEAARAALDTVNQMATVLRDFVGRRVDQTNRACHNGICPPERCGRCSREARAWDLLDAFRGAP